MEFHVPSLLGDEVPNFGVEFVAGVFKAGVTDGFESAFINDPGFEASVIGSRDIPRAVPSQAIIARQSIFDGDGEAMANVEIAVGVRGRHDNAIVSFPFHRVKNTCGFPSMINLRFKFVRFIRRSKFHVLIITRDRTD